MTGTYHRIFLPFCRYYSQRFIGNKPADSIYRVLCSYYFWRTHRCWPNLKNPTTFNEHLLYKQLNNRDPLLTTVSDKCSVREYVSSRVGGSYLVDLLWSGVEPERIPFEDLPNKFVIKTSHSSGWNIIVQDLQSLDLAKTRKQLKQWLSQVYCYNVGVGSEWCYRNIEPKIIIEAFLGEGSEVPVDFKYFCFDGRVEFLQIHLDRFTQQKRNIYNRDFKLIDAIRYSEKNPYTAAPLDYPRPSNYEEMVNIAEQLSSGFDFVRVDLYSIKGRVYFGELTNYPAGAMERFRPDSYDTFFGSKWPTRK